MPVPALRLTPKDADKNKNMAKKAVVPKLRKSVAINKEPKKSKAFDQDAMDLALNRSPLSDYHTDQEWISDVLYKYMQYSGAIDPTEDYDDMSLGEILNKKNSESADENESEESTSSKNEFIPDEVQNK